MDGADQELSGAGDVHMVFWLADQPNETTVAGRCVDDRFWAFPPRHIMEAGLLLAH
ncbi:hypothetical protein [Nonomuraea sp. SBT364]|uniref:hypothetical protein n=1 Tax=Nonomuraea sp. SBT364 TaxID=1580530 RepID=UPI000A870A3C|nr:hypothetical protein [Nonomuraea sp. SBT364]